MDIDLQTILPLLLPKAISWAEEVASRVKTSGRALTIEEITLAGKVGVVKPDLIRLQLCDYLPMPEDPLLQAIAVQTGLLGTHMAGLTLGYSVLVCRGHETRCLFAHEFRHVFQYEQHGSIAGFLPVYLRQIAEYGYKDAPFEVDARTHESAAS